MVHSSPLEREGSHARASPFWQQPCPTCGVLIKQGRSTYSVVVMLLTRLSIMLQGLYCGTSQQKFFGVLCLHDLLQVCITSHAQMHYALGRGSTTSAPMHICCEAAIMPITACIVAHPQPAGARTPPF